MLATANQESNTTNKPSPVGTVVLLMGVLIAYATIFKGTPSDMVRLAAVIVGLAILVSFSFEIQFTGFRNVIRVDNAAIFALYFLTLFEFLFPQPFFDELVTSEQTATGLHLVLIGIASVAIGRHLVPGSPLRKISGRISPMTEREMFWFAVICFVLGHLHMWVAVGFNPIEWISQMLQQRFTQDWQQGRLGGWSSLLSELHWLTYILPAIAGYLWVRRKQIPVWMLVGIGGMLVLVLFAGISLGARYRFAFYVLSFIGGFMLSVKNLRAGRVIALGVPGAILILGILFFVVNFRNLGLRTAVEVLATDEFQGYSGARSEFFKFDGEGNDFKFIVDRNMYPLSVLPSHFPDRYPFLEDEILLNILVRPLPRALWPGKPESLSVTTEGILGIDSATIASTIIGEGFMAYGVPGVVVFCLVFGILLGLWNRIPISAGNPTLVILYSLGFVWAALAARSVVWISMGFLPVIALFLYAGYLLPVLRGKAKPLTLAVAANNRS